MDNSCSRLDGLTFYNAFSQGCKSIFRQTENLNKINVFPVADRDTGTNLSLTLKSMLESCTPTYALNKVLSELADSGLTSAQGNSGIIFVQYLAGLATELANNETADTQTFSKAARQAVDYVYEALLSPVEGTVLTVMRSWADELVDQSGMDGEFTLLLEKAKLKAVEALANTPNQMQLLAKAGVPDAGAQGFVNFLEGMSDFIASGFRFIEDNVFAENQETLQTEANTIHSSTEFPQFRYCAEAVLTRSRLSISALREKYKTYGDSFILAGRPEKLHLHIHSNQPELLFAELHKDAEVSGVKADDMLAQYNIVHNPKAAIGLMTDSAADLPVDLSDKYHILSVPFGINFPQMQYLDKVTIQPGMFYKLLKSESKAPTSSLPTPKSLDTAMHFMATQYEQTICLHISSGLSSTYQVSRKLAEQHKGITVLDSRHLSVTQGLLLLRIARAIEQGMPLAELIHRFENWKNNTWIYTDIATLKYMVRSGRVSPLKGLFARLLNIKPIVSVDTEGKGMAWGKSFSRSSNLKKILQIIKDKSADNQVWEYAIVHSAAAQRASLYAEKLTGMLNKPPAYIMELSPVVGVHNGIGAVAVGISLED